MTIRALNLYYARDPSVLEQVLETRLRASDVRLAIGVARGRVFRRAEVGGELPDVMWDCPFADAAAHERDMQTRAASAEFEACRARMRALTRRFERVLYDFAGGVASVDRDSEAIVQCWVQQIAPVRDDTMSPVAAIRGSRIAERVLAWRRIEDNAGVPSWIIESPRDTRSELAAVMTGWRAQQPQSDLSVLEWKRAG
jgi:hypothetical protein